jgi:hypothetical protein
MFIADSIEAFQRQFTLSLHNMLSPHEAGAFILVLANSMQNEALRLALKKEISSVFKAMQSKMQNNSLVITGDDLAVIQALESKGVESLVAWRTISKDIWELTLNPVRALRPARASTEVFDIIHRSYDESTFNFNKPFLRPEILWEGHWQNRQLRVLFNKFPFIPYHLIVVPDPQQQLPQFLTAEYQDMMWQLLEQQRTVLPGFGIGYNSLGACASVNQLHFQGFIREALLPVELHQWQHNGGDESYPMNCTAHETAHACWQEIDAYNKNNQPYNLLYRPGRCYVLPRVPQGNERVLPRVRGAGWIEQCGVFNVSDHDELESVSATELEDCLRSLSVCR